MESTFVPFFKIRKLEPRTLKQYCPQMYSLRGLLLTAKFRPLGVRSHSIQVLDSKRGGLGLANSKRIRAVVDL